MKICVVTLDQASPEVIFQDERLLNIRRLADAGLYGLLESVNTPDPWKTFETSQSPVATAASLWTALAQAGLQVAFVQQKEAVNGFADLKQKLTQNGESVCFIDRGLESAPDLEDDARASNYYLSFDEQIGSLMEALDDQTLLLLLSVGGASQPGFFVLVSPNCPLSGEHDGATVLDLAPTVLDLAGCEIPSSMQGRSLVAGMEKRVPTAEDHEKIIYDRLAGLGYV